MQFIDLAAQQQRIRPQIEAAIKRVLDHGQYIMGPEVRELEERLADFVGIKHVIGCSSGTDALLLSLMAYEIGPGDAVFTTPFTFFASCETIALTGAMPVFVDIDPRTFNIDPIKLDEAISTLEELSPVGESLTPKAVMPVDLFGLPADYDEIMRVAAKHGLTVIEDGAQAFGATYGDQRAPGLAHIGATSFFPAKPLGCYGDGGAVFTNDDGLAEKVRSLLVHGKGKDKYNNVRIGLNARLDTVQAAILLEKLKIFPEELELRESLAQFYTELLRGKLTRLTPPFVPANRMSAWAQYTIRCQNRDRVQSKLRKVGIPSMVYYEKPTHLLDALSELGYQKGDYPESERASEEVLSLPFHPYLTEEQALSVFEALEAALLERA